MLLPLRRPVLTLETSDNCTSFFLTCEPAL
jgi:hypothetical protein